MPTRHGGNLAKNANTSFRLSFLALGIDAVDVPCNCGLVHRSNMPTLFDHLFGARKQPDIRAFGADVPQRRWLTLSDLS
jgi:hypothetical protein